MTYALLKRAIDREIILHTFSEGQGAALLFLWGLGSGLLILALQLDLLVAPWSGLAMGLGWLTVRDAGKNQSLRARLARRVIERRYPAGRLEASDVQLQVSRAHDLFQEVFARAIHPQGQADQVGRTQLLEHACTMVATQYESARQAQEFARVLRVVGARTRGDAAGVAGGGLLRTSVAAIGGELDRASEVVEEIVEQLQTLLLQLAQLDVRAIDLVRAAEFAAQSRDSLERMDAEVNTRREIAAQVIADLNPRTSGSGVG